MVRVLASFMAVAAATEFMDPSSDESTEPSMPMTNLTADVGRCGTKGSGKQTCVNNKGYTCTDCGPYPCLGTGNKCWSCKSKSESKCYAYGCYSYRNGENVWVCSGSECDSSGFTEDPDAVLAEVPADQGVSEGVEIKSVASENWVPSLDEFTEPSMPMTNLTANVGRCGTKGSGKQTCVNNKGYTCTDCGPHPCLDTDNKCWSCKSKSKNTCYAYGCYSYRNGENVWVCSGNPCDSSGFTEDPDAVLAEVPADQEVSEGVEKMII